MSRLAILGQAKTRLQTIVNSYVMTKDRIHYDVCFEIEKYLKELFDCGSSDSKFKLEFESLSHFTVDEEDLIGVHGEFFLINKENGKETSIFPAICFFDNGSVQIQFDDIELDDDNDPNLSKRITDASEVRGIIENWVKNIFPKQGDHYREKDFVKSKMKWIDDSITF